MHSRKHQARIAGVLYLLLGVSSALEMSIPSVFIVDGDAAATVGKIASSQLLYRLYVVSGLVAQILFVFLVLALYQLLKGVNRRQAVLMVALVLVQVPVAICLFACACCRYAGAHILQSDQESRPPRGMALRSNKGKPMKHSLMLTITSLRPMYVAVCAHVRAMKRTQGTGQ